MGNGAKQGSAESILKKGLSELALEYSATQISAFMVYLAELKKWNNAYNLTAIRKDEDIVIKHFLDSLLYLKALPEGNIRVLDVGSGAGFPGIPVKIMRPEIAMYLLEPSRKKAGFLAHIVRVLGLDGIEVMQSRIEDMKGSTVDAAMTRALFDIKDFVKKASPLVRAGGRIILSKGPKVKDELSVAGNIHFEMMELELPLSDTKRFIVIVSRGEGHEQNNPPHRDIGKVDPVAPERRNSQKGSVCINIECRLRSAGCSGFEGCPGFKGR